MTHAPWSLLLTAALLLPACNQSPRAESAGGAAAPTQAAAAAATPAAEPAAAAAAGKKRRVFVSNYQLDTVSVLEGDPEIEIGTISGVDSPHGLAIRPVAPRLLAIANSTGFGVTLVDPDTLEQKAFVETTRGPQDLEFSPDGKRLYVISPLEWELHVIDVDALKVVGEKVKFDKKPRRIVYDAGRDRLYVLLVASGTGEGAAVAVLDPQTLAIDKTVPVGRQPQGLAFGNDGRTIVSASFDDSTLTVIDAESLEVKTTLEAPTGMGLAVHPTKPIAYSTESFEDTVYVIDLETGAVIKEVTAGQWPTYPSFGANGRYLYIPHEESDSLVKLDTETNEVVAKAVVGKEPIEVVVYEP